MCIRNEKDAPRSLASEEERHTRKGELHSAHVAPLTAYVESLRADYRLGDAVPYFDPRDGGIKARTLILLETPGPRAVSSGFVSRNNPDETAENLFGLLASISRCETVIWNFTPWSQPNLPSGAAPPDPLTLIPRLVDALPHLEYVVLCGRPALSARAAVLGARPNVRVLTCAHPGGKVRRLHPKLWAQIGPTFANLSELLGASRKPPECAA